MSIRSVHGTDSAEAKRRWFFDVGQQWTSLFGGCNWYDFTIIKLQGEFAPYTGRWEFEAGLLGFGFCITYVYDKSFNDNITDLRDEIVAELEGRTGCEVKDPFGVLDDIKGTKP